VAEKKKVRREQKGNDFRGKNVQFSGDTKYTRKRRDAMPQTNGSEGGNQDWKIPESERIREAVRREKFVFKKMPGGKKGGGKKPAWGAKLIPELELKALKKTNSGDIGDIFSRKTGWGNRREDRT